MRESGDVDRVMVSLPRYLERTRIEVEVGRRLKEGRAYGAPLVCRRLWEHLGLAHLQATTEVEFSLDETAFAMVLHCILDPGSERRQARGSSPLP